MSEPTFEQEIAAALADARKATERRLERKLFASLDEQDECIKENARLAETISIQRSLLVRMHDLLWDARKKLTK